MARKTKQKSLEEIALMVRSVFDADTALYERGVFSTEKCMNMSADEYYRLVAEEIMNRNFVDLWR